MNNRFSYLDRESQQTAIYMMGWRLHRDMANKFGQKIVDEKYIDIMDNCVNDINILLGTYQNKNYLDGHLHQKILNCVEKTLFEQVDE